MNLLNFEIEKNRPAMTGRVQKRDAETAGARRFHLVSMVIITVFTVLFCFSHPSSAQATLSSGIRLTLKSDEKIYPLGSYIYATKEIGKKFSLRGILSRYVEGEPGQLLGEDVLILDPEGNGLWFVFTIVNDTSETDWVLSFGNIMSGRSGALSQIIVYEAVAQKMLLNTQQDNVKNWALPDAMNKASIPFFLSQGGKATFVVYMAAIKGMPTTISPMVASKSFYTANQNSMLSATSLVKGLLMCMAGFFLCVIVLHRMTSAVYFVGYFLFSLVLLNINDGFIFNLAASPYTLSGWALSISALCALGATYFILELSGVRQLSGRILLGLGVIVLAGALLSPFFAAPGVFQTILYYGPVLVCFMGLMFVTLLQRISSPVLVLPYVLVWFFACTGILVSCLASLGLLFPTPFTVAAYWHSFLFQSLFLIVTYFGKNRQGQAVSTNATAEKGGMEGDIAMLQHSKETAENERLRKMLEHERQVMEDLREREIHQNEELQILGKKAQEAEHSKHAFLSFVSHEIRTPLSAMQGLLKMLMETALDAKQKDYALTIQNSGDAIVALLNDILDFEKMDSGHLSLEHISFDLDRLVRGVVTLMSGHAATRGLQLTLDVDKNIPRYVYGDPVRLRQILLNLCSNAIKFTETGHVHLKIEKDPTKELLSDKAHYIRFIVEDTGIGISEKAMRHLFTAFSQADKEIHRKYGGTGLGLAICKRLVQTMGGEIHVSSTEGEGSKFYFTLMMEEGTEEGEVKIESKEALSGVPFMTSVRDVAAEEYKSVSAREESGKILAVEDNELNRKLINEYILRLGFTPVLAESGEKALSILDKEKGIVLILMDIGLTGMSGLEVAEKIRSVSDPVKKLLPIVAISGNVQKDDIDACIQAGMDAHIAKPVDFDELREKVERLLEEAKHKKPRVEEGGRQEAKRTKPVSEEKSEDSEVSIFAKNAENEMGSILEKNKGKSKGTPPKTADDIQARVDELLADESVGKPEPEKKAGPRAISLGPDKDGGVDALRSVSLSESEMAIEEDELEEDSFSAALEQAEEKENRKQAQSGLAPDVFDEAVLGSLREALPADQLKELIDGMFEKADELIVSMEESSKEGDMDATKARAHELKGMVSNFGLTAMCDHVISIEKAALESKNDELEKLIPELSNVNETAKSTLENWLAA